MTDALQLDDPAPPAGEDGAPGGQRRVRRPSWWSQAVVIAGLCWVYDWVNNLAAVRRGQAFGHAQSILRAEHRLHLAPELALNGWLAAHHTLGLVVGDYYDFLHFGVTLGLVGLLWWRHPQRYPQLRNTLVAINLIGFVVFWLYPLAPPRMLPGAGFIDVVAVRHAMGAWSSGALATQANELAAMPSLHMAWAVWCAFAVGAISPRRWVRLAGWTYAVVTGWVVIATANHYFLDVVAGVATALAAAAAASWWAGRRSGQGAGEDGDLSMESAEVIAGGTGTLR